MAIGPNLPSVEQVLEIAEDFGLELTADEANTYCKLLRGGNQDLSPAGRDGGIPPSREVPAHPGLPSGGEGQPLQRLVLALRESTARRRVRSPARPSGVKDAICVAGVPMMNGSRLLEGFIPRCRRHRR